MKRFLCLLFSLLLLCLSAAAEEEDPLSKFAVHYGSRAEKRIAITVDDCFDLSYAWKIRDMLKELGVVATFFPIGKQLKEEDRDNWRQVLDNGNEIGSHNWGHYKMGNSDLWSIIPALGRFQEQLDRVLGFHYRVNCFRPPYGNVSNAKGSSDTFRHAVKTFGYSHVILWDVSQTDPKKAIHQVQNGSILLYHTRARDMKCLQQLIPELLEQGYELVTVSDLLGFDPPETGGDLYVFNKDDYKKPST